MANMDEIDYKKEIEIIFKKSIDNIKKTCELDRSERAYEYFRNEQIQIRSRLSERLGKLIAERLIVDDIYGSIITGRPTKGIKPTFIYKFLEVYRKKNEEHGQGISNFKEKISGLMQIFLSSFTLECKNSPRLMCSQVWEDLGLQNRSKHNSHKWSEKIGED
jgi:hypothetical protein